MSHQSRRETDVRRRNGKLQSCEPCRKGKLRCDHMMPTCGRCLRRNKPEQCVYHPAPLTKALPIPQATESTVSSPSETIAQKPDSYEIESNSSALPSYQPNASPIETLVFPPFDDSSNPAPRACRASSLPTQAWSTPNHGQGLEDAQALLTDSQTRGASLRFLETAGFVSHAAILAENELSFGIIPANLDSPSIPASHVDKGALVLSMLKDLPIYNKYIEKWFSFTRGVIVIEPMVEMWSASLWTTWRQVLESQKADRLLQMSEKIWDNTMKPLSAFLGKHTTPREFVAKTTGEHLRWEVIGILLTLVGLLAQTLQDGDPIFCSHDDPPIDRRSLALKSFSASESCVTFCNDLDIMNDLYLWMLYENTILSCSLHAKESHFNFQKAGQLYNALLAFGLHREIKVDDQTPFFIAELRKRLFVCAYENDKYSSAFIGRPPRLTRHYCRIQLPLDLNDAQTMSDGLDLDKALAGLDHDGWNQRGTVQRCTFARIFASNAMITEEILEISIGVLSNEDIVQRAADIEARATRLWNSLPSFLRIDDQHPWNTKRAPIELLFLAHIRLADFGHHFLLQRTLVKKVGADATKLLAVSRATFAFILMLMNNRDILRDFQMDITQLLCMNGIPSAAVVAVELLHQEQDPSSTSALTNPLPRSETIQDLSVLVACLGSVRPGSGGYAICQRGKKFLKQILDTVLTPAPSMARSNSSAEEFGDASFTTPLFQMGSDGEFVRWLESMEWEQENWMNFN